MAWRVIARCPASDCLEEFPRRRYPEPLEGNEPWLSDNTSFLAGGERILKCCYCGLVWYWNTGGGNHFDAIPLGRYRKDANKLALLPPGTEMVKPRQERYSADGGKHRNEGRSR